MAVRDTWNDARERGSRGDHVGFPESRFYYSDQLDPCKTCSVLMSRMVCRGRHIATIPFDVRHTPGTVPEEPFGIGNAEFNAGKKQSKYGYPIMELYRLVKPIPLAEMRTVWGMGGAPMGWCYVKKPMWQDRWGEEQGRDKRVSRVF